MQTSNLALCLTRITHWSCKTRIRTPDPIRRKNTILAELVQMGTAIQRPSIERRRQNIAIADKRRRRTNLAGFVPWQGPRHRRRRGILSGIRMKAPSA